jgi:hypothetical protein
MSQLYALLYKNIKIMGKQRASSLMMLIVPVMCLVMALSLQKLAKKLADDHPVKPPFDIPFGAAFPINIPLYSREVKPIGVQTCLRMNKYGFSRGYDAQTEHFVDRVLNFNTTSGVRRTICQSGPSNAIISPHFNKTSLADFSQTNKDIIDQMEDLYESELSWLQSKYNPTEGYYIFDKASFDGISGTLQSNNMVNSLYHHWSLQNSIFMNGIPVS